LAGVHIAGKVLKWEKGEASIIGWLLQTKALIMIIFVNISWTRASLQMKRLPHSCSWPLPAQC
jgi:hypothetical protein